MNISNIGSNQIEIRMGEKIFLVSYSTVVAANVDGKFYKTSNFHSKTTSKHINSWLGNAHATIMPQEWFDSLI